MPFHFGPFEAALLLFILIPMYFVPTFIAVVRHVERKLGIILLNIFAGWTAIGWAAALAWAIKAKKETKT